MSDYDPATCVTAAELRAAGVDIPADLPGFAWVPFASVRFDPEDAMLEEDPHYPYACTCVIKATFLEPFRWLELLS